MNFKFFNDICEIYKKIYIFDAFLNEQNCHSNDYFGSNNFCEIYQTECIYNEFQKSWETSDNNFKSHFLKTNHICLTRQLFLEYSQLKMQKFFVDENKKKEYFFDVILSGLNFLTATNQNLFDLNKKLQKITLEYDLEIEKFIKNEILQENLKRMLHFYSMFKEDFLLEKIFFNNLTYSDEKIEKEIPKITNNKFPFKVEDSLRKNNENQKIISEDFLLVLPPYDKTKILLNPNLHYLLNWNVYVDFTIMTKHLKRFTIENIYEYLKLNYSYLKIEFDEIFAVVDKRSLNKNAARMTIFNLIE